MKNYSSIQLRYAIGLRIPGGINQDCFTSADGYGLSRDGDTVSITHAQGVTVELPWSAVKCAVVVSAPDAVSPIFRELVDRPMHHSTRKRLEREAAARGEEQ